VTDRSTPWCAS